jgi:EAL domain-containing protein (putative c-di-GMP-specific phosphodiesterase class I)
VQSADDAALLKTEGVDFMQGFYYGRPQVGRPGSKMPKRREAAAASAVKISRAAGTPIGVGC